MPSIEPDDGLRRLASDRDKATLALKATLVDPTPVGNRRSPSAYFLDAGFFVRQPHGCPARCDFAEQGLFGARGMLGRFPGCSVQSQLLSRTIAWTCSLRLRA